MFSLAPALVEIQVNATHPRSNPILISPADKESLDLDPPYGSHIHIDPPAPMPNDIIRITVSGDWPNVCVPRYYSHQIMGNVIRIDAVATLVGACIPVELPKFWSFDVEVGPLPVALYTIKLYILDPVIGPIPYGTASFLVSTERLYLPIIYHTTMNHQ
jgi:hypothetical protein